MTTDAKSTKFEFQAEVQQLLDIVIHSLYTDKDVFVRELVSNASDALEKMRFLQHTEKDVFDDTVELEISITTDEEAGTITFQDHGLGMTREELQENIGTIAHSGSKKFLKAMSEGDQKEASLIGQFGVGFYSAFMVAEEVKVYTHSWRNDGEHLCWTSDGKGSYEIEEEEGQRRGCKIVVKLLEEQKEFASEGRIKGILENYSSFVPFPVLLNGERVNKIEAIWLKNKSEVSEEQYTEFYKFNAKAFDEPRLRMHFSADAPIVINSLLFVPQESPERFGMGQTEPGVDLYCKKVLVDPGCKGLLPEWLRFLKGVVDSEDLPLNISRESMQDSALLQKLNQVVTKRFLKTLEAEAKKDREKYDEFYSRFSRFLKEGVAVDFNHKEQLAKLLRFESSFTEKGKFTSLADYLGRAKEGQEEIYFQIGQSRDAIESGPYLEAFQARGIEVLYLFEGIDEYVMSNLMEFDGKQLMAVERADVKLDEVTPDESEEQEAPLAEADSTTLCEFMKEALGDRVEKVEASTRLKDSPALVLLPEGAASPQMRQMMRALKPDEGTAISVNLEVNPRHALVKKLAVAKENNPELAKLISAQILDNAMLSAGLLEESKDMVARVYEIMGAALPDGEKE